jgi:hypothetical protein
LQIEKDKNQKHYRLIFLFFWCPTLRSLSNNYIMASPRSSSKKFQKNSTNALFWKKTLCLLHRILESGKIDIVGNKNIDLLKKHNFFILIASLLARCLNSKWPIFGSQYFLGLNQLTLLDQKINKINLQWFPFTWLNKWLN